MPEQTAAEELAALKERIEEAQASAAKAQGEVDGLMRRLKEEFGCTTLAQLRKKLEQLKAQEAKLEEELEAGIEELRKEMT